MSNKGNVGDRRAYETGDQEHYNTAEVKAAGAMSGINAAGYSMSILSPPSIGRSDENERD